MTALNARTQRRLGTDASRTATDSLKEADAIFGTWDFKWPIGSKINVAFQFPRWLNPDKPGDLDTFSKTVSAIQDVAGLWLQPSLRVEFNWLSPHKLTFAATNCPETDLSTELLPQLSEPGLTYGQGAYDVLVSLDCLSLDGRPGQLHSRYALPSSELGTYCRRSNYGEPTVYLGPLGLWKNAPSDYYATPAGNTDIRRLARFHILHEFGHVLGLVHTHQDPEWRIKNPTGWPHDANLNARLDSILRSRLDLSAAYLARELGGFDGSHITAAWPGNALYSDWRSDQGNSVMFVPFMHCLNSKEATAPTTCPDCLKQLAQTPKDGDLEQLAKLYA